MASIFVTFLVGGGYLAAVPYIFIYCLSKFQTGTGITTQRIWIMLWMASGHAGIIGLDFLTYAFQHSTRISKVSIFGTNMILKLSAVALVSAACIGGMVMVVHMISNTVSVR